MIPYSRFKRRVKREDIHTTAVNITKRQKQFLDSNRINLSSFLRDTLDNLIKQHEETELEELKKAE